MNPAPPVIRIVRIRSPVDPVRLPCVNHVIEGSPTPTVHAIWLGTGPNGVKRARARRGRFAHLEAPALGDWPRQAGSGDRPVGCVGALGTDRSPGIVGTHSRSRR